MFSYLTGYGLIAKVARLNKRLRKEVLDPKVGWLLDKEVKRGVVACFDSYEARF